MNRFLYYIVITFIVIASYFGLEHTTYVASWRVHLFAILLPSLILLNVKNLNLYASLFIYTILMWHIVDVSVELFDKKR